ncbi:MAG: hypothetical protein R3B06_07760 [Kofleriaceae bacterium]
MFTTHLGRSLTVAAALAALAPTLTLGGCATDSNEADAEARVAVVVRDAAGTVVGEAEPTVDAMLSAIAALPSFQVDGVWTRDPAALLHGTRAVLPTVDGKQLELWRSGNQLHRTDDPDRPVPVATVAWNDALDELVLHSANGRLTAQFVGLSAAQAEQFIGYTALQALDPNYEVTGIAPVVAVVGLAVVGYLGCITLGSYMCERAARTACGEGNVEDYKTICGAGYDFEGKFQLGYNCAIKCKPAATPAPTPTATPAPAPEPEPTATPTPAPAPEPTATPTPASTPGM